MSTWYPRIALFLACVTSLAACSGGGSSSPAGSTPPTAAPTASALFEWDANTETDLAGYKIYKGATAGQYGPPIATLPANATGYEATGLQKGQTYFFVVTAFDTSGNEGALSNELTVVIP